MLRRAQHRSLPQIINLLTHEEPCKTLHGDEQANEEMSPYQFIAKDQGAMHRRSSQKTKTKTCIVVEKRLNLFRTLHNPVRNTFFRILYRYSGLDLAISK